MIELRLSELAQSLGVACETDDAVVTGLAIDSRAVKPGDLFVAIDGEHVDGHDFIDKALDNGAAPLSALGRLTSPRHTLRPLIRSRSAHTMGNSSGPIPWLGDRNHRQCWQNDRQILSESICGLLERRSPPWVTRITSSVFL